MAKTSSYNNQFFQHSEKVKAVSLNDLVSFSKLRSNINELENDVKNTKSICYHRLRDSDDSIRNYLDVYYSLIEANIRTLKSYKSVINDFIKKMESLETNINTFISKLHSCIYTDVIHIKNKENGLKKLDAWLIENIKCLKTYRDDFIPRCIAANLNHIAKKSEKSIWNFIK